MKTRPAGMFAQAARRAVRRCMLVQGLERAARSGLPLFAGLTLLSAAVRFAGIRWPEASDAFGVVVLWAGALAVWTYVRRPTAPRALALWDHCAGRQEMFLSAWVFETLGDGEAGETLHCDRAAGQLRAELPQLGNHLRAPVPYGAVAGAIVFLAFAASDCLVRPLPEEDRPLAAAARQRAKRMGRELKRAAKDLERVEGASSADREAVQRLQKLLKDTAERIQALKQETPREVLEELERRAREAEKLAEQLEGALEEPLSSDLIAELERNADTADLAAALRAADAARIAAEAEQLAARLKSKTLSLAQEERLRRALQRALDKANARDRRLPLHKDLSQTLQHLNRSRRLRSRNQPQRAQQQRLQAGQQLARMAGRYRRLQQRRFARRRLRQLASRLRQAGSRILGSQPSQLQRLSKQRHAGLCRLGSSASQRQLNQMAGLQGFFSGRRPAGPGQAPAAQMPQAGPGSPPGSGGTPVPGSQPGQNRSGASGGGGTPVPGASGRGRAGARSGAPGGGTGGTGGLQAGTGSAPYGTQATQPHATTETGVVSGAPEEGPSAVRTLPGRAHTEDARRARQDLALRFLRAEEEALSEEPLPISRRDQVRQYFATLRKQMEE